MRFKMALCQVVCLLITAMLHSSTAQLDALSIEALVDSKVNMIVEKLTQTYTAQNKDVIKKLNDIHTVVRDTHAQNKEVVAKLARHTTDAQQMAAAVKRLGNTTDNLSADHLKIRNQLTSVKSEVHQGTWNSFPPSCTALNTNVTSSYYIRPTGTVKPFLVRCDFNKYFNLGGGWTVFQHRYQGSVNFFRNWTAYKNGFGNVKYEHWLGLEKLHDMTKSGKHELLIVLKDFDGKTAYAHYKDFKIGSEAEKYKLTVGHYSGTAGDSLKQHSGRKFSTFDQDNDAERGNCAERFKEGWWCNKCYSSHLNGAYVGKGKHIGKHIHAVIWKSWKGRSYSLKSAKMMLRRR